MAMRQDWIGRAGNQEGIALLTVMLLLLIMTVLGIASITVTGLENKMAGFSRTSEQSAGAVESCVNQGVNIIQQAIAAAEVPAAFVPNPVPTTADATNLYGEILGTPENDPDSPMPGAATFAPDMVMNLNGWTVNGDIDRLYRKPVSFGSGYEGGEGTPITYRIDCVTNNAATGTIAEITAVYQCMNSGEFCIKAGS